MRLLISTSLSLPLPFPRIPALCRDRAGTMPTRLVCIDLLDDADLNLLSLINDGERPVCSRITASTSRISGVQAGKTPGFHGYKIDYRTEELTIRFSKSLDSKD